MGGHLDDGGEGHGRSKVERGDGKFIQRATGRRRHHQVDMATRVGERGDIIKTLHRELAAQNLTRAPSDLIIHDLSAANAQPVTGRVIARGLSDEVSDRHYLIIDATDGRTHYVDIGRGEDTEPTPPGSILRAEPRAIDPRPMDRRIMEIAAANSGPYSIDIHLRYDPTASEAFADTHVRRLEAMRRLTNAVTREPDGTWIIQSDHLDRVADYERTQARFNPVTVRVRSPCRWISRSPPTVPPGWTASWLPLTRAAARCWFRSRGARRPGPPPTMADGRGSGP